MMIKYDDSYFIWMKWSPSTFGFLLFGFREEWAIKVLRSKYDG
jgi:hypothetical protein